MSGVLLEIAACYGIQYKLILCGLGMPPERLTLVALQKPFLFKSIFVCSGGFFYIRIFFLIKKL